MFPVLPHGGHSPVSSSTPPPDPQSCLANRLLWEAASHFIIASCSFPVCERKQLDQTSPSSAPGAGRKRTQVVLTLQEGDLETGVVGVVRAQSSFLPHGPG